MVFGVQILKHFRVFGKNCSFCYLIKRDDTACYCFPYSILTEMSELIVPVPDHCLFKLQ